MRKSVILVALAVALSGCAAQRDKEMREGIAACNSQYPEVVGGYVARESCINAVSERVYPQTANVVLFEATRTQLAEKVDAKEISPSEMKVQLARLSVEIANQQAALDTQRATAAAALLSAMPQPQPSYVLPMPTPPPQMPVNRPWTANCTQMGNFTTCNGN